MRKHIIYPFFGCVLATVAVPCAGAAEVYKWTDEQGRVHYGDRPGQSSPQQIELKQAAPGADPTAAERQERARKLLDELVEERGLKREAEAKKQDEEKQRKANCALARERLDTYEHAGYLYEQDDNGNRRVLSEEDHKLALEQSRKKVEKWCKPGG